MPVGARVYSRLFDVEEPTSEWESELNPTSEVALTSAVADVSVRGKARESVFQMERVGYFCIDMKDSHPTDGGVILNQTVTLREDKGKRSK